MAISNFTDAPTLEEILVALQKTFSRLSSKTGEHKGKMPDEACALIMGNVEFEVDMNVQPVNDPDKVVEALKTGGNFENVRFDKLSYCPSGSGIGLKLKGIIRTDIRVGDAEKTAK
jgi:hypothetical protein